MWPFAIFGDRKYNKSSSTTTVSVQEDTSTYTTTLQTATLAVVSTS